MTNSFEESGIAFMAEFPRRQAPATLRLKELIATRLGEPRLLFCHRRVPVKEGSVPRTRPKSKAPEIRDLVEGSYQLVHVKKRRR